MSDPTWLIYGANGYTGELIAREARRRKLQPVLAGRRARPLMALGRELDLEVRVVSLLEPAKLDRQLTDIDAVLHCAGPFVHTWRPMVEACLRSRSHYFDITGEIGVFEAVFGHHRAAREAGIVLMPGVGLDVVPTDCLAAHLHQRLPAATHLELALYTEGGQASRGTLVTMLEGLVHLGAERVDGELVPRPLAFDCREIEFSAGPRWAMTIPWGDLSTAFRTTGIPNIRVYMGTSRRRVARLRRLSPLLRLPGVGALKSGAQWWIRRRVSGPDEEVRATSRCYFWGAVRDDEGNRYTASLDTPEGYRLTASTAVESLRRVLETGTEPGAWTPATAFGADFIRSFEGVTADW